MEKVKVNKGYKLTPVMSGMPRLLGYVIGRDARNVNIMISNEIVRGKLILAEREEFFRVTTSVGDYNLMPWTEIHDLNEFAEIKAMIDNRGE